jgi:hypothetical protein
MVGPRDLQAGHRIIELLGALREAGACELVRLLERVHYVYARRRISKVLAMRTRELGMPSGELEDQFDGPTLDGDLSMRIAVGPYAACLHVNGDLRRVRTSWISNTGKAVRRRPARTRDHPQELELVAAERRRLQSHVGDIRSRFERAMTAGRSWSVES